jgi:hypothetical protein
LGVFIFAQKLVLVRACYMLGLGTLDAGEDSVDFFLLPALALFVRWLFESVGLHQWQTNDLRSKTTKVS